MCVRELHLSAFGDITDYCNPAIDKPVSRASRRVHSVDPPVARPTEVHLCGVLDPLAAQDPLDMWPDVFKAAFSHDFPDVTPCDFAPGPTDPGSIAVADPLGGQAGAASCNGRRHVIGDALQLRLRSAQLIFNPLGFRDVTRKAARVQEALFVPADA